MNHKSDGISSGCDRGGPIVNKSSISARFEVSSKQRSYLSSQTAKEMITSTKAVVAESPTRVMRRERSIFETKENKEVKKDYGTTALSTLSSRLGFKNISKTYKLPNDLLKQKEVISDSFNRGVVKHIERSSSNSITSNDTNNLSIKKENLSTLVRTEKDSSIENFQVNRVENIINKDKIEISTYKPFPVTSNNVVCKRIPIVNKPLFEVNATLRHDNFHEDRIKDHQINSNVDIPADLKKSSFTSGNEDEVSNNLIYSDKPILNSNVNVLIPIDSVKSKFKVPKEGEVSNNFVRLNMKRKSGTCKSRKRKLKDNVYSRRIRSNNESQLSDPQTQKLKLSQSRLRIFDKIGIDPLQIALDNLEHLEPSKESNKEPTIKCHRSTSNTFDLDDLLRFSPTCFDHNVACKIATVRKTGSNKGRKFYCCSLPRDQQCDFFMWIEDNPSLLKQSTLRSWTLLEFILTEYQNKLANGSLGMLKQEFSMISKRRSILMEYSEMSICPLIATGSKEVRITSMIKALKDILLAIQTLSLSYNECKGTSTLSFEPPEKTSLLPNSIPKVISTTSLENGTITIDNISNHANDDITEEFIELSSDEDELDYHSNSDIDSDIASDTGLIINENEYDETKVFIQEYKSSTLPLFEASNESRFDKSCYSKLPIDVVLQVIFGHKTFRPGQKWAVNRCLQHKSSLLVLPTGSGKTLCFTLPTILMTSGQSKGIAIVVSPLIALMEDQALKLPPDIRAKVLKGNLSLQEVSRLLQDVIHGRVNLLFISPERLCSRSFRNFIEKLRHFRNDKNETGIIVSLLCVDEAHCLSRWSFNFRPAFMSIRKEIKFINPSSVLAVTATASPEVRRDIMFHIGIEQSKGSVSCLVMPSKRDNIKLSAMKYDDESTRNDSIFSILKNMLTQGTDSNKFTNLPCTIIYTWKRFETEVLSEFLKSKGVPCGSYHAGMDTKRRETVQSQFSIGKLRVIVATCAFGMGVDKGDIKCVIHNSLPSSIDSYIQEIGRAGRDGSDASCHLLYSSIDIFNHYSLALSSRISLIQVLALLCYIFRSKYSTLSISNISSCLDISETVLETILLILEIPPFSCLEVVSKRCDIAIGSFKNSKAQTNVTAFRKSFNKSKDKVSFSSETKFKVLQSLRNRDEMNFRASVSELAETLSLDPNEVIEILYELQRDDEIQYQLTDMSFGIRTQDKLSDTEIYEMSQQLISHIDSITNKNANRVLDMYRLASCIEMSSDDQHEDLQTLMCKIMDDSVSGDAANSIEMSFLQQSIPLISEISKIPSSLLNDIKVVSQDPRLLSKTEKYITFIQKNSKLSSELKTLKQDFMSLCVLKIFLGIYVDNISHISNESSILDEFHDNNPSNMWKQSSYWGKYRNIEHKFLLEMIKKCIFTH